MQHSENQLDNQQNNQLSVLIVDGRRFPWDDEFAPERTKWESLGAEVSLAACESEDDLIDAAAEADILVYRGNYTPFTPRVIRQLTRCRLIARYGVGMDSVDLRAATEHGIVVSNAAGYCAPDVGDHTVALIFSLARRIVFLDRWTQAGKWRGATDMLGQVSRLSTQVVGLVGFGNIARAAAVRLAPSVAEVVASDPYVTQGQADAYGVRMLELDELLETADYVSMHTPLMPQTKGLMSREQFARMKSTAFLVNTSRGPVVDEAALVEALRSGQIAGAALDVFEEEPLAADSPLRDLDNVVLTPHLASYSTEALVDLRTSVTRNVADALQGYWPPHVMNPSVQPRYAFARRDVREGVREDERPAEALHG